MLGLDYFKDISRKRREKLRREKETNECNVDKAYRLFKDGYDIDFISSELNVENMEIILLIREKKRLLRGE